MSVPEDRRKHGKLEVNTKALALCVYTLRITANGKIFTSEQDGFVQRIRACATDIHTLCWKANNIHVGANMRRYEQRIELEARAIDECNALCAMIEIAKPLFHLTTKRVIYWTGLVTEVRELIRAWRESDIKRLKPEKA